ncbi:hypothetical protein DDE82_005834 [Stemphylium lycopersici]|uniref:Uncharacterized protein n=1 Tax=Stemphylium lycopersici TaxID=183478 RepID=A0A364N4D0_STELY|nr:hypothetical protein TW65_01591 [Stemphylium lycopersici]RAR02438.1 hypothetical protein DDE82_005834 [Stemphylium lycopersici]RAR11485.1 hypothetical protein DDE83_004521 [Stemphylium lycopersici]
MAELAQLALQNELFLVSGFGVLLFLPPFNYYLQPAIHPNSAPEQFQLTPGAPTIVTQTATIFPKATTLTTTTTTTAPLTIFDSITKYETSILTSIDRRYLTKWTHFPVDSATQCSTSTSYPDMTALLQQKNIPDMQLNETAGAPLTTPWIPWAWTNWILLALLTFVLGLLFLVLRVDLVNAKAIKTEGNAKRIALAYEQAKRHAQEATDQAEAIADKLKDCRENSSKEIEDREIMLRFLGVYEKSDGTLEKETLLELVKARIQSSAVEKARSQELEAENGDQSKKIQELESEKVRLDEIIKTRLSERYVPGVDRSLQSLLDDKQCEVKHWRRQFFSSRSDENAKEIQKCLEEKDAELLKLRRLPAEIAKLKQELDDASKQIEKGEEEKKDQGVADRRRWNEEKHTLIRKHADTIRSMRANLEETKRSAATMEKAAKPNHASEGAANDQFSKGMEEELATANNEAVKLRQKIWDMGKKSESLTEDLERARKERDDLSRVLQNLNDKSRSDQENCENKKRGLRQRITQLQSEAQTEDKHAPAAGDVTETELETSQTTLNSKKLSDQVRTLAEELKTAKDEKVLIERLLEEAKAQVATVSKQLEEAQATDSASRTSNADIDQYQAEIVSRSQKIQELEANIENMRAQADNLLVEGRFEINARDQQIQRLELEAIAGNQTIHRLQQKITAVQSESDPKDHALREKDAEIQNQRNLMASGGTTVDSLNRRMKYLEAEIVAKNTEIQKLGQEVEEKTKKIQNQQAAINSADTTVHIADLNKQLKGLQDKYQFDTANLKHDAACAQAQLNKEQEQAKENLNRRKEKEKKNSDKMQQEIDQLKNSSDSLKIKELEEALEKCKESQSLRQDLPKNGKEAWKKLLSEKIATIQGMEKEVHKLSARSNFNYRQAQMFRIKAYLPPEKFPAHEQEAMDTMVLSPASTNMQMQNKRIEELEAYLARTTKQRDSLLQYSDLALEDDMNGDDDIAGQRW